MPVGDYLSNLVGGKALDALLKRLGVGVSGFELDFFYPADGPPGYGINRGREPSKYLGFDDVTDADGKRAPFHTYPNMNGERCWGFFTCGEWHVEDSAACPDPESDWFPPLPSHTETVGADQVLTWH